VRSCSLCPSLLRCLYSSSFHREHIISGDSLTFDTEGGLELIRHLLETYFKPHNCAVMVKYKGFQGKTTLEERWYGTQYNSRTFTEEEFGTWHEAINGKIRSSLHLPVPNPFISTDFTLHAVEEEWRETHEHSREFGPVVIAKETRSDQTIQSIYTDLSGLPNEEVNEENKADTEKEKTVEEDGGEDGQEPDNQEEEEEAPAPSSSPAALVHSSGRNHMVWFLQDSIWKVPKMNVFISLRTGYAYHSPLSTALCELYSNMIKESLNEFTYYADCAGLYYDISHTHQGFDLSYSGYHDKLPLLINKTLQEMNTYSSLTSSSAGTSGIPEMFQRLKEKILRGYANTLYSAPYHQCLVGTLMCLEDPRWPILDKYHALKAVTLESFSSFCTLILQNLYTEMFITGNITPQQARELTQTILSSLPSDPLSSSLDPIRRTVALQPNREYHYRLCAAQTNPNELNSAIENSYLMYEHMGYLSPHEVQEALSSTSPLLGEDVHQWDSLSQSAVLSLLSHLLTEPLFDQLRTKEQLGYIVHSSPTTVGSLVRILSPSLSDLSDWSL
jgi:secreted Zn-dependent insulinase-like peptidase